MKRSQAQFYLWVQLRADCWWCLLDCFSSDKFAWIWSGSYGKHSRWNLHCLLRNCLFVLWKILCLFVPQVVLYCGHLNLKLVLISFPLIFAFSASLLSSHLDFLSLNFLTLSAFPSLPSCIMSNYRSQCVYGELLNTSSSKLLFVFACLSLAAILGALPEPWWDTSLHSLRRLIL